MPFDQAPPIQTALRPNWELPEITAVKIRATPYQPRATKNFKNPIEAVPDAVEIVLTLKSPMPVRAMGPVLYVGGTRLTESEAVDKEGKQLRFWAFDRSKLRAGAPISMMWDGDALPKEQKKAKFTYSPPK
jgi:hypothetical protein